MIELNGLTISSTFLISSADNELGISCLLENTNNEAPAKRYISKIVYVLLKTKYKNEFNSIPLDLIKNQALLNIVLV